MTLSFNSFVERYIEHLANEWGKKRIRWRDRPWKGSILAMIHVLMDSRTAKLRHFVIYCHILCLYPSIILWAIRCALPCPMPDSMLSNLLR